MEKAELWNKLIIYQLTNDFLQQSARRNTGSIFLKLLLSRAESINRL